MQVGVTNTAEGPTGLGLGPGFDCSSVLFRVSVKQYLGSYSQARNSAHVDSVENENDPCRLLVDLEPDSERVDSVPDLDAERRIAEEPELDLEPDSDSDLDPDNRAADKLEL